METATTEALTVNSQNRSSLARTAGPRPARKRRRAAKPQSTESATSDTKIVGPEAETPPMRRSLARTAKASATATKRTKETAGNTHAQSSPPGATKLCQRCGRTMEMRKKWRDVWDEVKYCSKACSKAKLRPLDTEMEQQIVKLLQKRAAASTICPSEVPRFLGLENWRDKMEPARQAVRRLAARGIVEVRQRGQTVDPFSFRGPIRVGRGDNFDAANETSSGPH